MNFTKFSTILLFSTMSLFSPLLTSAATLSIEGPQDLRMIKDTATPIAGGTAYEVEYTLTGRNGVVSHAYISGSKAESADGKYAVFVDAKAVNSLAETSESSRKTIIAYGTKGAVRNGIRYDTVTTIEIDGLGNKTELTGEQPVSLALVKQFSEMTTPQIVMQLVQSKIVNRTTLGQFSAPSSNRLIQPVGASILCWAACAGICGPIVETGPGYLECVYLCVATACRAQ